MLLQQVGAGWRLERICVQMAHRAEHLLPKHQLLQQEHSRQHSASRLGDDAVITLWAGRISLHDGLRALEACRDQGSRLRGARMMLRTCWASRAPSGAPCSARSLWRPNQAHAASLTEQVLAHRGHALGARLQVAPAAVALEQRRVCHGCRPLLRSAACEGRGQLSRGRAGDRQQRTTTKALRRGMAPTAAASQAPGVVPGSPPWMQASGHVLRRQRRREWRSRVASESNSITVACRSPGLSRLPRARPAGGTPSLAIAGRPCRRGTLQRYRLVGWWPPAA